MNLNEQLEQGAYSRSDALRHSHRSEAVNGTKLSTLETIRPESPPHRSEPHPQISFLRRTREQRIRHIRVSFHVEPVTLQAKCKT